MAERVDATGSMVTLAGAMTAGSGFGAERKLRVKRATGDVFAPESFTGCVSAISSRAEAEPFHADAFKRYAEVYEAYQAYLMPVDPLAAHDYELGLQLAPSCRLGCLDENLVDDTLLRDDVTDEDIERCGYLGWLHH